MLQIENKDQFGKVIAESFAKVEPSLKDDQTQREGGINAISKVAVEIEQNGAFVTWQDDKQSLPPGMLRRSIKFRF